MGDGEEGGKGGAYADSGRAELDGLERVLDLEEPAFGGKSAVANRRSDA